MDLAEVRAELYAADPGEFIALRTERVKQARAAKDRELATAIGALRRPTRSAAMVNRLAREDGTALGQFLDLGAALAQAQRDAAGPELRRLSAQRHAAVSALVRRASELGAAAGQDVSESSRQEVGQTLTAALADPDLAAVVRSGQVTQAVSYGGFGPDLVLGPGAATPATMVADAPPAPRRSPAQKLQEASDEAERAMVALDAAQTELEQATAADESARADLADAEQQVALARRRLAEAEDHRDTARQAAEQAADRLRTGQEASREAEQSAFRAAAELKRAQR